MADPVTDGHEQPAKEPNKTVSYGRSHQVYSKQAALTFEIKPDQNNFQTVFIDGARVLPNAGKKRTYDWKNKLTLQVTKLEMPVVLSVLCGLKQSCEYRYHGSQRNKSYKLQREYDQYRGIVAELSGPGQHFKVLIQGPHLFYLNSIFMEAVMKEHPELQGATDVLNFLKTSIGPFLSKD